MIRITDKKGEVWLFIKKVAYVQRDKNEIFIDYTDDQNIECKFERKGKNFDLSELAAFVLKQGKRK